jgi:hypothetical protein
MRLMSFSETTQQVIDQTKTVTRRKGWLNLRPGDRLRAVRKAMGLRKGEHVEDLAVIEVVSVRREPIGYVSQMDVVREGFPDWSPRDFITLYCRINRCDPWVECTRIEFRYVEEVPQPWPTRPQPSQSRPQRWPMRPRP